MVELTVKNKIAVVVTIVVLAGFVLWSQTRDEYEQFFVRTAIPWEVVGTVVDDGGFCTATVTSAGDGRQTVYGTVSVSLMYPSGWRRGDTIYFEPYGSSSLKNPKGVDRMAVDGFPLVQAPKPAAEGTSQSMLDMFDEVDVKIAGVVPQIERQELLRQFMTARRVWVGNSSEMVPYNIPTLEPAYGALARCLYQLKRQHQFWPTVKRGFVSFFS